MKNIAINIRGQYREWDNAKHSLFKMFDILDGHANVVYFFTTWETSYYSVGNIPQQGAEVAHKTVSATDAIKDTFEGRNCGGVQILSPDDAKIMVPVRLEEEYDQIMFVRYAANELKKKYEKEHGLIFDIVVETRPDLFFLPADNVKNIIGITPSDVPLKDFEILGENRLQRTHTINKRGGFASSVFVNDLLFACNSFTADLLNDELMYAIENTENKFFRPLAHDRVLEHMFAQKMVVLQEHWRYYNDVELIRPQVLDDPVHYIHITEETLNAVRKNRAAFEKLRAEKMFTPKANVVIPMAGLGSRFAMEGYQDPKPFIDVNGKPMIARVVEHLGLQKYAKHIFICQKSHMTAERKLLLESLADDVQIIEINGVTEGAAATVLFVENLIDNEGELFIVNSDQLITWDLIPFLKHVNDSRASGAILCFKGFGTNWSYAKTDESGRVVEVAEKKQISEDATAGLYYYKRGSDFVKSAKAMIKNNIRTNNEFYVAPVYNEFIKTDKVVIYHCDKIDQLGTPIELKEYLLSNATYN